jgi:hypothetical protein
VHVAAHLDQAGGAIEDALRRRDAGEREAQRGGEQEHEQATHGTETATRDRSSACSPGSVGALARCRRVHMLALALALVALALVLLVRALRPDREGLVREKVVERQVVVTRCAFCDALTPVDARRCERCGAERS